MQEVSLEITLEIVYALSFKCLYLSFLCIFNSDAD